MNFSCSKSIECKSVRLADRAIPAHIQYKRGGNRI